MLEFKLWKDKSKALIDPDLFAGRAEKLAELVSKEAGDGKNKPTQLRRFYDDVLSFGGRMKILPEDQQRQDFEKNLPYLKMLQAKVTYAQARNLVGKEFKDFLGISLKQVNDLDDFKVFQALFEAFMGYYKFFDVEREKEARQNRSQNQRGGR